MKDNLLSNGFRNPNLTKDHKKYTKTANFSRYLKQKMSKREVGLLRLLQQPYSFGLDNPLTGTRRNIVAVDNATVVLTADQCGATVLLGGSGAGTATLPSVENGVWFNFMVIPFALGLIKGSHYDIIF